MSVSSTDIKIYGAANHAETDGITQGGAIDLTVVMVFDSASDANTVNDTIDVVSDNAGDTTQTVTVHGRNSGGSLISEVYSLDGTTEQTGATTFERVMKIVVSATHTGDIDVHENSGSTTIGTILGTANAPGGTAELEMRRPFYDVSADVSGGSSRDYYEKCFVKNNNSTDHLLSCVISEQADPSTNITFDLEDAKDDNNSTADRLDTAPTGMLGSFDSSAKNCPGTDLEDGEAIGVWLKLTLAAGTAAAKTTYTLRAAGSTT